MNKLDLVEALQNQAGISKNKAEAVVRLFINEMANALANGDRVEIRGLCSFCIKNYKHIPAVIRKPVKRSRLSRKSFHFLNAGKN